MRIELVCIVLVFWLNGCTAAESDDIKPLFDKIDMDTSLGIRIKIPALEKALKSATAAFWLKGLADVRSIDNLAEANSEKENPKRIQEKQAGAEKWEWRVSDVFYYYYERILLPEGKGKMDHDRFTQAERDQFIKGAVAALKELKPTDLPVAGSMGRP